MNANIIPANFHPIDQLKEDKRMIVPFRDGEIWINHSIADRVEFIGGRCNLTLKNPTDKKHSVNVTIRVLNKALIEIWSQSERWIMKSLMPGEVHSFSWPFAPAIPAVVWNEKARLPDPAWVMVDVI